MNVEAILTDVFRGHLGYCPLKDGPNYPPKPAPTRKFLMTHIAEAVADATGGKIANLRFNSRQREYSWPRFVFMALCRKHGTVSDQDIARFLGFDHTSVRHGAERAEELRDRYLEFSELYDRCEGAL